MDSIQEEFLRQKRALERLMVGGGKAVNPEAAAEEAVQGLPTGGGEEAVRSAAKTAAAGENFRGRSRRAAVEMHGGAGGNGGLPMVGSAVGIAAVEHLSAAVQTEKTDARALSRAIQRDARRYDGGFSLY